MFLHYTFSFSLIFDMLCGLKEWRSSILVIYFFVFLRIGKHVITYLVQIHVLLRFLFPPFSSRWAWQQPKKERMKSDLFGLKPTETKLKHQINVVFFSCFLFSFFSFPSRRTWHQIRRVWSLRKWNWNTPSFPTT